MGNDGAELVQYGGLELGWVDHAAGSFRTFGTAPFCTVGSCEVLDAVTVTRFNATIWEQRREYAGQSQYQPAGLRPTRYVPWSPSMAAVIMSAVRDRTVRRPVARRRPALVATVSLISFFWGLIEAIHELDDGFPFAYLVVLYLSKLGHIGVFLDGGGDKLGEYGGMEYLERFGFDLEQ